jgi:hypothetical protein
MSGYTFPAECDLRRFRDTLPPVRDWVIEGMEPGDVGIVSAPGGTGKSMLCLSIGLAVASGRPLFGQWKVGPIPGDVLYIFEEDSAATLHHRMHALAQLTKPTDDELGRLHAICVRSRPPKMMLQGVQGLARRQKDEVGALLALLDSLPNPRLLILDPLLKFHTLDENSNNEMNQFMELMGQIAERAGVAVILVHHTAKGKSNGNTDSEHQEAARGASAIINEARWQASLRGIGAKTAKKWGLDEDQARRYLWLTLPKRNNVGHLDDILLERGFGGVLMGVGQSTPSNESSHLDDAAKKRFQHQEDNDDDQQETQEDQDGQNQKVPSWL